MYFSLNSINNFSGMSCRRDLFTMSFVLKSVLVSFFVTLLLQTSEQTVLTRRLQRAISTESTTNGNKPPCHGRTPCGWAVYKPFTRRFDYYMENTCECTDGKSCLRTDDDLSVSAYVYTCRYKTTDKGGDEAATPPTSILRAGQ